MNVRIFDSELERFAASLEDHTIAKVLRTIDLLKLFGNKLGLPHSRKIEGRLFELRIRGKQEVRIFYVFVEGEAVLLHAFVKKTDRIPRREIAIALKRLSSFDKHNV